MSLRLRFGGYRVDLAILLAWLLAVPLGGLLAYGVLFAAAKVLSMVALHNSLPLAVWFSTAVAYLLPATTAMAAAIICIFVPIFATYKPSAPDDRKAFGHAVVPQAIVNAAWLLVYCSAWGLLTSRLPNSPSWQFLAFWLGFLVVVALEVWQRATTVRFSQSYVIAGGLRSFPTWLRHPCSTAGT